MRLFALAVVVAAGVGYLGHGRLKYLLNVRLPAWLLILVWTALGLQLSLLLVRAPEYERVRFVLIVMSYTIAAVVLVVSAAVAYREHFGTLVLSGMITAAAGWILNFVVIAANQGMPVSRGAVESVGRDPASIETGPFLKHITIDPDTRLQMFADRIPLEPLKLVVSAGNLLLAVGIGLFIIGGMTARPANDKRAAMQRRAA